MANETGTTNVEKVMESVERPAEMEQDGRRARAHNLVDQDAVASRADSTEKLRTSASTTKPAFGIKTSRIQPGGSA